MLILPRSRSCVVERVNVRFQEYRTTLILRLKRVIEREEATERDVEDSELEV